MTIFLGKLLATLLTLTVFSRAFVDSRMFRLVAYLLLGMGSGYLAAIVLRQVLLPALNPFYQFSAWQVGSGLTAFFLIGMMGLRFASRPDLRAWGLIPLGWIAGVGGALAVAGAMRGTLLPQLMAVNALSFFPGLPALDAISVIVATLTSFGVLLFLLPDIGKGYGIPAWGRRIFDGWRVWGYWMFMLALGALLASIAGARITLLIQRVTSLLALWL